MRHLLKLAMAATTMGIVAITLAGNAGSHNSLSASPTFGTAPLEVTFSGTGSGDSEGIMLLDFGDGQTDDSISPIRTFTRTHTYAVAGSYTAELKSGAFGGQRATTLITVARVTITVQ